MRTRSQNGKKLLNESLAKVVKSGLREKTKSIKIQKLIEDGANINYQDLHGNTLLHLATSHREVFLLSKFDADASIKNFVGETPLLYILKKGRKASAGARKKLFKKTRSIVREFIRHYYRSTLLLNILNEKDTKGITPLFEYIHKNECDKLIVEQFVHIGANYDVLSSDKNTLLHAAVSNPYCKVNVVKYLLQLGLNPNAENSSCLTPLHFCVRMKNFKLDIIEELIKNGANVMPQSRYCRTPLLIAVLNPYCNRELLKVLLKEFDLALINNQLGQGLTLLHAAMTHMNIDIIETLITSGADVNALDSMSRTSLHLAVEESHCDEKIVSLLVKYGANVNTKSLGNFTPLHTAFKKTANVNVIKTLLQYNATLCVFDILGFTPLHYLVRNSNLSPNIKVSFLIELLSTEKSESLEASLNLTANTSNFLYMCSTLQGRPLLLTVLKYLHLKYHAKIYERRIPYLMETFYSKLDNYNWNLLTNFSQLCLEEVNCMRVDRILDQISFYDIMINEFSQLTSTLDNEVKRQMINEVLVRITNNQYPIYKDMIMYVRKRDFLKNLDAVRVSALVRNKGHVRKITLDQFAVRYIAQYLSKEDVINLILAYSNDDDSFENEDDMNMNEEKVRVSYDQHIDLTREVRVEIPRLSQENMKKLCQPCSVVIRNSVETKMLIDLKKDQHACSSSSHLSHSNLHSCKKSCDSRNKKDDSMVLPMDH